MAPKHEWGRLVGLSGNALDDYRAVQPYIQEAIDSGSATKIDVSKIGTVFEYTKNINGEEVIVRAVQLLDDTIQITDAWVKGQ